VIAPTARQLELVSFWCGFTDQHGYPPTLREAGAALGIQSTNGVNDHVNYCELKGLLRRTADRRNRGIIVTDLARALVGAAPPPRSRVATGTVITEQRCACGVSFFVEGQARCSACARAA
jgi:repressor LexA